MGPAREKIALPRLLPLLAWPALALVPLVHLQSSCNRRWL